MEESVDTHFRFLEKQTFIQDGKEKVAGFVLFVKNPNRYYISYHGELYVVDEDKVEGMSLHDMKCMVSERYRDSHRFMARFKG